jgi:hypothetical protein
VGGAAGFSIHSELVWHNETADLASTQHLAPLPNLCLSQSPVERRQPLTSCCNLHVPTFCLQSGTAPTEVDAH